MSTFFFFFFSLGVAPSYVSYFGVECYFIDDIGDGVETARTLFFVVFCLYLCRVNNALCNIYFFVIDLTSSSRCLIWEGELLPKKKNNSLENISDVRCIHSSRILERKAAKEAVLTEPLAVRLSQKYSESADSSKHRRVTEPLN